MDVDAVWQSVEQYLSKNESHAKLYTKQQLAEVALNLNQLELGSYVHEWLLETFKRDLMQTESIEFWNKFQDSDSYEEASDHLLEAFEHLHAYVVSYNGCFDRLQTLHLTLQGVGFTVPEKATQIKSEVQLILKTCLFARPTLAFQNALLHFYSAAFQAFESTSEIQDPDESGNTSLIVCSACELEQEECTCAQIIDSFHNLNNKLKDLGLFECLSAEPVATIIHQKIKVYVENNCKGNFEEAYLHSLETWLESKVVAWLHLLYGRLDSRSGSASPLSSHKERLYHYMCQVYANTRIQELFNIIIEYPESEPALTDLKDCLEKTHNLRSPLVASLRLALQTRLLHPGVNTVDILTAYISAIKALRVLDPSGVLLELVCEPVRKYLRSREDTVRSIVSGLTEESGNELSDELVRGQPVVKDENFAGEDISEAWESWQPDPIDAGTSTTNSGGRDSDIISMLVNIYGSKELFVNEYRTLLADRILTNYNYQTDKEIRYLELLKLRFGETQLHTCEVMLKDVSDSRRINGHVKMKAELANQFETKNDQENQQEELIPVEAMILSAQFWPTFREEKLAIPEKFQKSLDKYTKGYEAFKGNRTLNWKNHLGLMSIEVELKDRTLELTVSPVYAVILWHFQEKSKWSVEELSSKMHLPTAAIRRKIAYWQSHGVLREEEPDVYVLLEEQQAQRNAAAAAEMIVIEEEEESAMASSSAQREEELQVLWSYVVGMLTNLESLTLDRIQSMLKMFAMQGPTSDVSPEELKGFLDRKVKEQKLTYSAGVYRLHKPG